MSQLPPLPDPDLPTQPFAESRPLRTSVWRRVPAMLVGSLALAAAVALLRSEGALAGDQPLPEVSPSLPASPARAMVSVAHPQLTEARETLRFSGIIAADRDAELAFAMPGRISDLKVEVGQRVRRGQLLANLDRGRLQAELAAAMAGVQRNQVELDNAARQRDRLQRLSRQEAATEVQVEGAETQVLALASGLRLAKAQVAVHRQLLSDTGLRAPFTGIVSAVHLETGEFAGAGRPILRLTSEGSYELEVEVPESLLDQIDVGRRFEVTLPMLGRDVPAEVRSVSSPKTEGISSLFSVRLQLDDRDFVRPGMTAELLLSLTPRDEGGHKDAALALPMSAVQRGASAQLRVMRVREGLVDIVPVELLRLSGSRAIVRGALGAEDEIIVDGPSGLQNASQVEVLR